MTVEPNESDGPEDLWAREHEDELIGSSDEDASFLISTAGFRPFVFHAATGHALAANKIRNTVTLISVDGIVRSVRH